MPRTSNKQEEILQYIDQFVTENGYPPSVREIGAAVGLRSTASVSYHLNHLQAKGLVTYEAGKKRALSVPNTKTGQIPIIGVVTAGIPHPGGGGTRRGPCPGMEIPTVLPSGCGGTA